MWVIAIVSKEQWDSCSLINLIIYSKLGEKEPIYLVILSETYKNI